jgi:hypothetical protein
MALYEIKESGLVELASTGFSSEGILERGDLQRLFRDQVEVISPDTMVIAEEFSDWEDSKRRIDLLGLDKDANLVVIELKRTETGGHMELQAIRYAAMVSPMTFQQVVEVHSRYLKARGLMDTDAQQSILTFLEWESPNEDEFAKDVRIVLASAEFSREITTAVIWLNERGLDIRCVRLRPHKLEGHTLVHVEQIIPIPEAAEYQVRVRVSRESSRDYTKYDLTIGGQAIRSLSKRRLIYEVVAEAIRRGVSPEDIGKLSEGNSRMWVWVDGVHQKGAFIEVAAASQSAAGRAFDQGRYFISDEDLFHLNGRTYALSNQWGHDTLQVVDAIIERMQASDVSYIPSVA